jgi:RNA polymerase sigma factor (sigma-70 family)
MTPDSELLRRYVHEHSEEAFGQLVHRHIDLVYSSALRRVGSDAQLAEDVTQEVFAALARKGGGLIGRSTLAGWLYTTSRHKAIDVVRSEKRRRLRETETLGMNVDQESLPDAADWQKLRPLIDTAMDSLSKADQEILVLRYFENRSFAEAAGILSTTEDAARMRSTRALERLRAVLSQGGFTSAAEMLALLLANKAVGAAPAALAAQVLTGALSSAPSGILSLANLIKIMNASKVVSTTATLALLLASVATAVHEAREHRRMASALAAAREHLADAESRASSLARQLKADDQSAAALQASVDAAAAALEAEKSRRAQSTDPHSTGRGLVSRNPGAGALLVNRDIARNTQRYVALFSSLGLKADQQAQFLRLLAQRSSLGLTWNTTESPDSPAGVIGSGSDSLSDDQLAAQMRGLLGNDGYQKYTDFDRSSAAQSLAQQLAGLLYATSTPLAASQASQVAQILAQSSADYQGGKGLWSPAQINWEAALGNAQAVLTAPQMAALRNLQEMTAFDQAAQAAANQAAGAAIVAAEASLAAASSGQP